MRTQAGKEVDAATTRVGYDADAIVGGMIGGVGQRMLVGAAKKTAGEFFANVNAVLTGTTPAPTAAPAASPEGLAADRARPGVYTVPPAASEGSSFALGVAVGAAAALLGAIVGGWLSRRRA